MAQLYKYPRTPHLPFSEGATSDDKMLSDDSQFKGKLVVITEKMDGENISIYRDSFHARSLDSKHKSYHSWLAQYVNSFNYMIPEGMRICGEYLYAQHSIRYDNLKSYFYAFSVWSEELCLEWNKTLSILNELGVMSVPILYRGTYYTDAVKDLAKTVVRRGGEGIVVRCQNEFTMEDFSKNVAKYVRPNHVQTDKHWSQAEIVKNGLIL